MTIKEGPPKIGLTRREFLAWLLGIGTATTITAPGWLTLLRWWWKATPTPPLPASGELKLPGDNPDIEMYYPPVDLDSSFQLPISSLTVNSSFQGETVPSAQPQPESKPELATPETQCRKQDVLVKVRDFVNDILLSKQPLPATPTKIFEILNGPESNIPGEARIPDVDHPFLYGNGVILLQRQAALNTINELQIRLIALYKSQLPNPALTALQLFNDLMSHVTLIPSEHYDNEVANYVTEQIGKLDITSPEIKRVVLCTPDTSPSETKSGSQIFQLSQEYFDTTNVTYTNTPDNYKYFQTGNTVFVLPKSYRAINAALSEARRKIGKLTEICFLTDNITYGKELAGMMGVSGGTSRNVCEKNAVIKIFSTYVTLNPIETMPAAIWSWRLFEGAQRIDFDFRHLVNRWIDISIHDPLDESRQLPPDEQYQLLTRLQIPYYAVAGTLKKPGAANTSASWHPLYCKLNPAQGESRVFLKAVLNS